MSGVDGAVTCERLGVAKLAVAGDPRREARQQVGGRIATTGITGDQAAMKVRWLPLSGRRERQKRAIQQRRLLAIILREAGLLYFQTCILGLTLGCNYLLHQPIMLSTKPTASHSPGGLSRDLISWFGHL